MCFAGPDSDEVMVLKGVVLNQHNQPMPYANVKVLSENGKILSIATDESGSFVVNVKNPEGKRDLTLCVEYVTYKKEKLPLQWKSGEEQVIFKLKPGSQPIINPQVMMPASSRTNNTSKDRQLAVFIPY